MSANAQEAPRFTFDGGFGFTNAVGSTSGQFNDYGWNIEAGVGMNFNPWLGAKVDVSWNGLGINNPTLQLIGAPDGNIHVFAATFDPVIHLTPRRHFDFYLTVGGGLYHLNENFTQPTTAVGNVYDPLFDLYPQPFGATPLYSYSVNKPGYDVGGGIAFGGAGHGKFFAEAKMNHVFLVNSRMDYLPVSFGFRW
jgi:hypothetical protein